MVVELEFDLASIQSKLLLTPTFDAVEIFGDKDDQSKGHVFSKINDYSFLYIINAIPSQDCRLTILRENFICIQILFKGHYLRFARTRVDAVNAAMTEISNFPRTETHLTAGILLRGLALVLNRGYLEADFALSIAHLPEAFRAIFTTRDGSPEVLRLRMAQPVRVCADQIMACPMPEPLRNIYIRAKAIEMLCEIVAQLKLLRPGDKLERITPPKNQVQAIEAAALIYTRELQQPPKTAQLASRLGLNRNQLTEGFRSVFGTTPHAYSRDRRMEAAKALLADADISISEVARRVGYEGYASFSKAFLDKFGYMPSIERTKG
jgi:AraC family transcriptional activator of pyochelin receptor